MMKASYISGIIQPKVIMTLGFLSTAFTYIDVNTRELETYRPGLIKHTNVYVPVFALSSVLRSGPLSVFGL